MRCSRRFFRSRTLLAVALIAAPAMALCQDFLFADDFEPGPSCAGVPSGNIAASISPAAASLTLGMQEDYLVKVLSCGYVGAVTLQVLGTPPTWTASMDPASLVLTLSGAAESRLLIHVPSNGDAGNIGFSVQAQATNTVVLNASLNVINEFVVTIPLGIGPDDHQFPPIVTLKLGASLRVVNGDTTPHRMHGDGGTGFPHQASDMGQGQSYLGTPSQPGQYMLYCHDHLPASGQMTVNVN